MHHIARSLGFLAVFLMAAVVPHMASANDADFKLVNRTGYEINAIYISPHSSAKWGRNVLGKQVLDSEEVATITFPHGNGACVFDIKVRYSEDSSTAEWSKVDLCEYTTITLYWDAKAQVTRAVGE